MPAPDSPLPAWDDPKLGTMKRAALWLITVVGEDGTFTKEDLRAAFPGVAQIDRRMRDLRAFKWRIDTNREDSTLDAHEQRFVQAGIPVWEPGRATPPRETAAIGATRRREVLQRDGNMCRSCGITPGETYAGTYETAQLDIARRRVAGEDEPQLVTECKRCRVAARELEADLPGLLSRVRMLSRTDRALLATWLSADERELSDVERAWAEYRSLPGESRARVRRELNAG